MRFYGVLWKNIIQKAYLPKISIPAQIVFCDISPVMLWWLHTGPSKFDSVHNIRNWVKFSRICMESSEQNGTSISEKIHPTMLIFGKEAFQKLFFQSIPTNPIISKT